MKESSQKMKFSRQSWFYLIMGLIFASIMAYGLFQESVVDVLYGGFALVIATMFYLK